MADQRKESADAARDRQSRLAPPVGRGLVKTVDNFGARATCRRIPSCSITWPTRFVRDGWSIKKLVRAIVLTRAYRLAADASGDEPRRRSGQSARLAAPPRRLDAEEIRDATLAAAGQLDLSRPVASPAKNLR